MQRVLDSSPVLLQPAKPEPGPPRRSLKRTASLASLPTPPRTVNDKKRARREVVDHVEASESDDDVRNLVNLPVARVLFEPKGKKRVVEKRETVPEETEEDVFWLGKEAKAAKEPDTKLDKSKAKSTLGVAPASPPPSKHNQVGPRFTTPPPSTRRQTVVLATPDAPASPRKQRTRGKQDGPIRDSPNNLFLVDSKAAHPTLPEPESPSVIHEEPPTISYVFRGKKKEFPNPLYNLPAEAHERSNLPPEHPDFSPSRIIRPRRLFVKDMKNRKQRTPTPPSPSEMLELARKKKEKKTKMLKRI